MKLVKKDEKYQKLSKNLFLVSKILFVIGLILVCIIIAHNHGKPKNKWIYVGNSILETPNLMPENCTVGQMEYYEHLVSTK